jgi:plasmid stability protein
MPIIRIHNVPDQLHRELKERAASNGNSLSNYLLAELRSLATRPTMREWLAKTESLTPVECDEAPAEAIRAERERRPL